MTKSNHDKKRCDRWVWGSNYKIYVQTDDLCFDSLAEISIQVTFDVFLMLSRNQKIISPANFFFSLSLSHTTHTLPVSEFLNLHNTLHYLSRDALHAALSSLQVFEVTRSSHHLTYFIKNTWDTPQTGSLSLSLFQPALIHQTPRWAEVTTYHSSTLRAIPTFISSCD